MDIVGTILTILALILTWVTPSLEKKILIIFIYTVLISILYMSLPK